MATSYEPRRAVIVLALSCLAFVGCSAVFQRSRIDPAARMKCFSAPAAEAPVPVGRHFDHVLIIVFENQPYDAVMGNDIFKSVAREGANLTNFHALFHPSYSNYLAMVSGMEIRTIADMQKTVDKPSVACLLQRKRLTWKNYAESYPAHEKDCNTSSRAGHYARKHVPFLSFKDIQEDFEHGCSNVVSDEELFNTLNKHGPIPNYMFFSPNMLSDGHDKARDSEYGKLDYAAHWLKTFLDRIEKYSYFKTGTLIVVTFDESAAGDRGNHIYTVMRGPMVKRGCFAGSYTHYSVLRMVEDNFGLGTLSDGDSAAVPVTDEVFTREQPCSADNPGAHSADH
jgi:hypothetical protein